MTCCRTDKKQSFGDKLKAVEDLLGKDKNVVKEYGKGPI